MSSSVTSGSSDSHNLPSPSSHQNTAPATTSAAYSFGSALALSQVTTMSVLTASALSESSATMGS
ncbi:hypothetical protein ACFOOM_13480 [Streptomyces echinoruber]|jgi:hypothetical protein|uniref:Uncharacterized protein n=1 Tax=Streptomyces echinoruber TaxID=68898 RepID=A0A918RE69_9ACTN|nr:hypothetical protein [Streptomyces echinoruber]GGZ95590.1 hypothetical protein GCM10010389_38450 [Streptomyces echinoruber]